MPNVNPSSSRPDKIKVSDSSPNRPDQVEERKISSNAEKQLKDQEPLESYSKLDNKVSKELSEKPASSSEKIQRVTGERSESENLHSSSQILDSFMKTNNGEFIAHAIYTKESTENILDQGVLKPAEKVLYEGKDLEYEAGSTIGSRGEAKLPELTESEVNSLIETFLSPIEKKELEELQKRLNSGDNFVERGKEIKKLINQNMNEYNKLFSRGDKEEVKKRVRSIFKFSKNEDFITYKKYNQLRKLARGVNVSFKDNRGSFKSQHMVNLEQIELIDSIARSHGCPAIGVKMALLKKLYPSIPNNKGDIDKYLAKKTEKIISNESLPKEKKDEAIQQLRSARNFLLSKVGGTSYKLNAEIRFSPNKIYWGYGDVVIVKGVGNESDRKRFIDQDFKSEVLTPDTISNKGEYFQVDLKNEDNLIILGPKDMLKDHKELYGDRLVFIEDLTEEQWDLLKIPERLRPKQN